MRLALAAALVLLGALPARAASSPQRRVELDRLRSNWRDAKADARRMADEYSANLIEKRGRDARGLVLAVEKGWKLCRKIEDEEHNRLIRLSERLDRKLEAGELSPEERRARFDAVVKAVELRSLYVYGNLLPRIIDESLESDGEKGSAYVSNWRVLLTQEEYDELSDGYKKASGFPREEFATPAPSAR